MFHKHILFDLFDLEYFLNHKHLTVELWYLHAVLLFGAINMGRLIC